ncbi:MAG: V-type ATP synthase subunit E family protein [Candidatus Bathyarchaeota archaeon]|nr:V-type ATP synthase subunit E family protein [Candidatus Termiticorpusculum sp.]
MDVKNNVSAIATEVIGVAEKEAETVLLEAENVAKETLFKATEKADLIRQEILNQTNVKIMSETRKIASVTEVDIRNSLLSVKDEFVDDAFEKAIIKLKDFAASEKYSDYLFKIIEDAAKKLGQKSLILQVNAKDHKWLTQHALATLSAKLQLDLRLSEKIENYIGGCRIHTIDDKIVFDATLDNKLQELRSSLRVEIAKKMFGTI